MTLPLELLFALVFALGVIVGLGLAGVLAFTVRVDPSADLKAACGMLQRENMELREQIALQQAAEQR